MPSKYNLRSRAAVNYSQDEVTAAKALVALRFSSSSEVSAAPQYRTRSVAQASHVAPKSSTPAVAKASVPSSSTNSIAARVKKNPRFERVDYADDEYLPF